MQEVGKRIETDKINAKRKRKRKNEVEQIVC